MDCNLANVNRLFRKIYPDNINFALRIDGVQVALSKFTLANLPQVRRYKLFPDVDHRILQLKSSDVFLIGRIFADVHPPAI